MSELGKWAERLYAETDVGRSFATSLAGVLGLLVYLKVHDWVIAAFTVLIVFPIARVIGAWVSEKVERRISGRAKDEQMRSTFYRLSDEEREVVKAFIAAGGAVLTWKHVNSLGLAGPGMESLIARGLVDSSVTADGLRETFVLQPDLFDMATALERGGTGA